MISARSLRTDSPYPRRRSRQRNVAVSFRLGCREWLVLRLPTIDNTGCVRPTSASLHTHYEHLRLVGSRFVPGACGPSPRRGIRWFTTPGFRFGGSSDFVCTEGRFLPQSANRCDRASDTPVAPPSMANGAFARTGFLGGAETASTAFPVTGPRCPQSEVPSLDR
jgi:hypothetical protein